MSEPSTAASRQSFGAIAVTPMSSAFLGVSANRAAEVVDIRLDLDVIDLSSNSTDLQTTEGDRIVALTAPGRRRDRAPHRGARPRDRYRLGRAGARQQQFESA